MKKSKGIPEDLKKTGSRNWSEAVSSTPIADIVATIDEVKNSQLTSNPVFMTEATAKGIVETTARLTAIQKIKASIVATDKLRMAFYAGYAARSSKPIKPNKVWQAFSEWADLEAAKIYREKQRKKGRQ